MAFIGSRFTFLLLRWRCAKSASPGVFGYSAPAGNCVEIASAEHGVLFQLRFRPLAFQFGSVGFLVIPESKALKALAKHG